MNTLTSFNRYKSNRFPAEELLFARGVIVTYEAIGLCRLRSVAALRRPDPAGRHEAGGRGAGSAARGGEAQ